MATEQVLIKLNEDDLKDILCAHYNIDKKSALFTIVQYKGDQRDPSYVEAKLIGNKNK
jgi:hypothetical protein